MDAWETDYGSGSGSAGGTPLEGSDEPTDIDREVLAAQWAPLPVPPGTVAPRSVLYVDGVRRVEARLWISAPDGQVRLGLAATYAAGVVRCNGTAEVVEARVERVLVTAAKSAAPIATRYGTFGVVAAVADDPEVLSITLQQQMGLLESRLANAALAHCDDDSLIVVDGPLRRNAHPPGAVGSIKSQHRNYGPPVVQATVARLGAGERTPVFVVGERFARWSWYVRLPGPLAHPLASVVRCEAPADLSPSDAIALADRVTATLPRFASEAHKDPRAPQNLYPIAGLERALRRRLGDAALMVRGLRLAAAAPL